MPKIEYICNFAFESVNFYAKNGIIEMLCQNVGNLDAIFLPIWHFYVILMPIFLLPFLMPQIAQTCICIASFCQKCNFYAICLPKWHFYVIFIQNIEFLVIFFHSGMLKSLFHPIFIDKIALCHVYAMWQFYVILMQFLVPEMDFLPFLVL